MAQVRPSDRPNEITVDNFREWTSSCGVRRVQKQYEELLDSAHTNGRSGLEEMKHRGFKDYWAFSKSCPQFGLLCWPTEFGELGNGYVLYFHFLSAMMCLFATVFVMQLPVMYLYAVADHHGDRLSVWDCHDWRDGYSTHDERGRGCDGGSGKDYVFKWWLTAGNLGPDEASNPFIPIIYTVMVAVVCFLIFVSYMTLVYTDKKMDSEITSPNDFAILVEDLPTTATDEGVIKKFFEDHAVKGKTRTPVVKVVIGWDFHDFSEKKRKIQALQKDIRQRKLDDPQVQSLQQQIVNIKLEIKSAAVENSTRMRSSGVVVVSFQSAEDQRACLEQWSSFWARWFYCESKDLCCFPAGNGFLKGPQLERFPIGDPPRPVKKIKVKRAPNPGDICWEDVGMDRQTRWHRMLFTNCMMALLIAVSFGMTYGLNKLQQFVKKHGEEQTDREAGYGYQLLSMVPAAVVSLTNMLLTMAAKKFGDMEFHNTHTDREFWQAVKMTVAMCLNTAGILYFIYTYPKEWYMGGGLVNDAFFMLLLNSILPPLVQYVDAGYYLRWLKRRKLPGELPKFNEVIKKGQDPATNKELPRALQRIEVYKASYAPSEFTSAKRYANALKTTLCCFFYMPIMPLLSLVGLLGLALQYWVDKYLIVRWAKRPDKPSNSNLPMFSLTCVKLVLPIELSLAFFIFLSPSWDEKGVVLTWFLIALFGSVVFSIFSPLSLWAKVTMGCVSDRKLRSTAENDDYYEAQYLWSKEMKYHKDQFLYKALGDKVVPEYLDPDQDSTTTMTAVKESYGAAAQEEVGEKTRVPALRGGRVIGSDAPGRRKRQLRESGQGGGAHTKPAPQPVTHGVHKTSQVAPTGTVPEPDASPLLAAATHAGRQQVMWEYMGDDGVWVAYASDCNGYIERRYKEFLANTGKAQINVKTAGKSISVHFQKLTAKEVGVPTIRQMRRRET